MKLSFDDKVSFKEAAGSLCFNHDNPSSDTDTLGEMGSSTMSPPQERSDDDTTWFN